MKLCSYQSMAIASRFSSLSGAFACDSKNAFQSRLANRRTGIFFAWMPRAFQRLAGWLLSASAGGSGGGR